MSRERENGFFKFAERCLYEYPENCARLGRVREKLARLYETTTAGTQGWDAAHGGGFSDPVAVRGLKILDAEEEIERLTKRVEPIKRLLHILDAPALEGSSLDGLAKLIRLWYFAKTRREKIAEAMRVSRPALYRLREKAVELTAKYLKLRAECLKI